MYFVHLATTLLKVRESAWHSLPFLPFAMPYIYQVQKKFTGRLGNKPCLIWLLKIPPNLTYVTIVLYNLLLLAYLLTVMFRRVVWQHVLGVVGLLVTILVQKNLRISQWNKFENQLRFDRDITTSMVLPLYGTSCILNIQCIRQVYKTGRCHISQTQCHCNIAYNFTKCWPNFAEHIERIVTGGLH